uniref:Uncharacterized protein n=1 Tax=Chlamydomonas leiostraca TaxID=1034604 RepID=A0A7S0RR97_9CHLO|mmetsp:Transcript_28273/g.72094  ORF Transcript_28273/g.72094 Transcript_28273/m.72094 type:complete len:158 (+) Transcript_28273:102-575(+)
MEEGQQGQHGQGGHHAASQVVGQHQNPPTARSSHSTATAPSSAKVGDQTCSSSQPASSPSLLTLPPLPPHVTEPPAAGAAAGPSGRTRGPGSGQRAATSGPAATLQALNKYALPSVRSLLARAAAAGCGVQRPAGQASAAPVLRSPSLPHVARRCWF